MKWVGGKKSSFNIRKVNKKEIKTIKKTFKILKTF